MNNISDVLYSYLFAHMNFLAIISLAGKDYIMSAVDCGIQGIYEQSKICDESLGYFSENKTVSTSCVDSTLYLFSRGFGDSENKFKLLHAACYCGRLDAVRQLVEQHGVDISGESIVGFSKS